MAQPILEVVNYTEKSIAVRSPTNPNGTKPYKNQLKLLGGRFNPKLKDPKTKEPFIGWIFSKKKNVEVTKLIKEINQASTSSPTEENTIKENTIKEVREEEAIEEDVREEDVREEEVREEAIEYQRYKWGKKETVTVKPKVGDKYTICIGGDKYGGTVCSIKTNRGYVTEVNDGLLYLRRDGHWAHKDDKGRKRRCYSINWGVAINYLDPNF